MKIVTSGLNMKYDEFLSELSNAGLNVRRFAELISMNPNSVSNYAGTGNVPRHLAVIAMLLAELRRQGVDSHHATERVGAICKKPRGIKRAGRLIREEQTEV